MRNDSAGGNNFSLTPQFEKGGKCQNTNAKADAGVALANAAIIVGAHVAEFFKRREMRAEGRLQELPHLLVPKRC